MAQPVATSRRGNQQRHIARHFSGWVLAAIVLCALPLTPVRADPITWNGTVGEFNVGSNWVGGNVPQDTQSIVIDNGGTVQSSYSVDVADVSIGGGSTYAVLPGDPSYFTPNFIYLGTGGSGTLTIGSQAEVSAANDLYLGYVSGSTGVVSMEGGAYLSPYTTYIGYNGSGNMTLESGSTLQSTSGFVGYQAGSQGLVNLNDSTWKAEDGGQPVDISVGVDGQGEVSATNSLIDANNLLLGAGPGSMGAVSVSGGNLTLTGNLTVGTAGSGNFSLSNSASATNYAAVIAGLPGSTGSASVTDSSWTLGGNLDVGLFGNGTLSAVNSQLEAQELLIAGLVDSSGSVTLSGGTTTMHGEIHVGALGSGELTLGENGVLHSDKGNAGFGAGTTGIINVVDSSWTVTQAVFVGINGQGTVNIDAQGVINSESAYIGQNATGQGSVNITSGGSWSMNGTLAVGVYGTGNLTVSGGEIASVWGQIGLQTGSSGSVHLDNGDLTIQNTLTIGEGGNGQLIAGNGSTISAQGIELAAAGGVSGVLDVSNSTLETEVITPGGGNATLSLTGARINLLGGSAVIDSLLISGFASDAVVIEGGLIVDTQGGNTRITTVLSGNGTLTKEGAGRLRLTTANTLPGGTFINGGAIEVANDLALGEANIALAGGELRASSNSTLSGNLSSGIQLISVSANQTGTFSAVTGQMLTLAPLDFLLVAGSTMQVGSAGNNGTVVFAPTGAVALPADVNIVVENGTLQAGNDELFFMAGIAESVTVASGATLDFNDQISGGAIGNLLGAGTVTFGSSPTSVLAVDSGNFAGSIVGTGSLLKQSSGTLILSGNNTLTGITTVAEGTLQVDGYLGNGYVKVQPGATLGGSGTIVQIELDGGTLAPGSSAGTLTTAELLWYGGVMLFELGPSSDHLVADSLEGFGGPYYFTFADLGWSEGTTYDLISLGGSPIEFEIADMQYTNTGGFSGSFAFDNDVLQFTLHTIPEPSIWTLIGLSGSVLFLLQVRRRRTSRHEEV